MITPKQRAVLRALSNTLDPVLQIGKEGITKGTELQAEALFEARELFKIKVLKNCVLSIKEIADEFVNMFNCEIVQIIGNKISVYRHSSRNNIKHIQLP